MGLGFQVVTGMLGCQGGALAEMKTSFVRKSSAFPHHFHSSRNISMSAEEDNWQLVPRRLKDNSGQKFFSPATLLAYQEECARYYLMLLALEDHLRLNSHC